MGKLLKIGAMLVIGILIYNGFFGDEAEKAQSKEIFGKVRELGKDSWGLLKSEKAKYKEGKYDGAVDKVENTVDRIGGLLGTLEETANDINDSGAIDKLNQLQDRQAKLENYLDKATPETYDARKQEQVKTEIQDILRETEALMKEMEGQ